MIDEAVEVVVVWGLTAAAGAAEGVGRGGMTEVAVMEEEEEEEEVKVGGAALGVGCCCCCW